jgi:hypothetical protein
MTGQRIVGALVGWKRRRSANGIILTIQLATSEAKAQSRDYDQISFALNDRQIRSLARDMQRVAKERGIQLRARPRWTRLLPRF